MKDQADNKTFELPGMQEQTKRRGRPPIGRKSMTAAERKREQRLRQKIAVMAPECDGGKSWKDWTLAECLYVLSDPKLRKSDGLDAHKRLGVLLNSDSHKICDGRNGISEENCENPKHKITKQGQTWADWTCTSCGGSGRSTWD